MRQKLILLFISAVFYTTGTFAQQAKYTMVDVYFLDGRESKLTILDANGQVKKLRLPEGNREDDLVKVQKTVNGYLEVGYTLVTVTRTESTMQWHLTKKFEIDSGGGE